MCSSLAFITGFVALKNTWYCCFMCVLLDATSISSVVGEYTVFHNSNWIQPRDITLTKLCHLNTALLTATSSFIHLRLSILKRKISSSFLCRVFIHNMIHSIEKCTRKTISPSPLSLPLHSLKVRRFTQNWAWLEWIECHYSHSQSVCCLIERSLLRRQTTDNSEHQLTVS